MKDRTAIDTIKGYFYQFDFAIVRLLELSKGSDTVVVEGIEDVDVKTATDEIAIQCKYYAKTEYNHSVIAKPIRLMLVHYKDVKDGKKKEIKYKLYGHFQSGHSKFVEPIDIDFLKNHFLTYSEKKVKQHYHTKLGLSDNDLKKFISLLHIDIKALEYQAQLKKIATLLTNHFSCNEFEADHFYYNNALKVIKTLAVESNIAKRKISQTTFLTTINSKKLLFNDWFITYKGEKQLFADLRQQYFTSLNISSFERFFIIEINNTDYLRSDLKSLIHVVAKKWSKLSKLEPHPFCPYIYLHNLPASELKEIKKEFSDEGFKFIDGFDYQDADFNPDSISKPANHGNAIKLKIINEFNHIDLIVAKITKTKEIYQFFNTASVYSNSNAGIKNVNIQIKTINDIQKII